MNDLGSTAASRSRTLYIAEATLEYLISLLVHGSYLAILTQSLGISDSLTGIISSFISLGCLFQLCSIFIIRRRYKGFVVAASVINQAMFMLLYICPLAPLPASAKTALFVAFIFAAYFIYNLAHPKKINWFMSLVPDGVRGGFTAKKEMVSLICGIGFSFVMGQAVDRFKLVGDGRGVFVAGAVTIFALTVLHTLSMLFSVEPSAHARPAPNIKEGLARVWRDKAVRRVAIMFTLWNIAHYSTISFYGSYQIKELGLSQTVVAALVAVGSVSRIAFSIPMGKFADRAGFAKMLRLGLVTVCVAFGCAAAATPATGGICFLLYYLFHGVAMSGINSALINLIFDYVDKETRADALAVSQATAGAAGFAATLCVSPLVSYIQSQGNRLFGLPVYAQQVTSVVAIIFTVVTILYLHFVIIRRDEAVA